MSADRVDGEFASSNEGYELLYESFDDRPGLSDSHAKWEALKLPDVSGMTALDVGCNEGYFSGHLASSGAAFVFGFDAEDEVIAVARQRFPDVQFAALDCDLPWEGVIPRLGEYDLALIVSALHYSQAPEALIAKIHAALAPGGLLVFEGGVAEGEGDRIQVVREHDVTWHFTHSGLERLFADWRIERVTPSITQATDPIPRFVYHVRR